MKKLIRISIISFIILSTYSCKNENSIDEYSIGEITATAKEISWKDLNATIEHIQLETTGESLIADILDLVMTEEYIFVLSSTPKVLQFARDGKFIRQISMQGNGPEEYRKVFSILSMSSPIAYI